MKVGMDLYRGPPKCDIEVKLSVERNDGAICTGKVMTTGTGPEPYAIT